MTLRSILSLLLAFSLAAVACGGGSDSSEAAEAGDAAATSEPAVDPTAEPEPEPDPTPEPTAEPEEEPTEAPEPDPTAAPEPEPTAEPEPAATTATSGCGSGETPGISTVSFEYEGRERIYEQVVPAGYDDTTPLPVVLNWHGLGSNGVEQLGFSDYVPLADAEGFVVIAPTGVPSPGDNRNSWELDPDQDATRDDLAFANEVLDRVLASLCVDESRVYTTGMSNGGYFSSVLVCEMSDRIAAAASVAALSHADDCEPERIVPYIGFHGTEDEVVPFAGGGESSLAPGEVVELFLLEIPAEFAEFAIGAGCDVEPVVADYSDNVISYDYQNCEGGVQMTFYEIEGAGHTWPGSLISLALSESLGLGVTTAEISASQASWDFFEQYSLDDGPAAAASTEDFNLFSLAIGTCFVLDEEVPGAGVIVDCSEPHEGQKFFDVPLEFPDGFDNDLVRAAMDPVCRSEFEAFVGRDYDSSALYYIGLGPTEDQYLTTGTGVCIIVQNEEGDLWDFDAKDSGL